LRSVLQVGGTPDAEEALSNWHRLTEHNLDFQTEEDKRISDYLVAFYGQMSAPPDFVLVREFFEKKDDIEACSRLDEVKKAQHYIRTNFLSIIRSELEQQQTRAFVLACRDAANIAEHGRNLDKPLPDGKKILRGVNDAMGYMFESMSSFSHFESGEKLEGLIHEDADEVLEEYDVVSKSNVYAGRNLVGLQPVDEACEGHRSGEFWCHCAYPGELKTTLALNYAYNNAYVFGKNIFYGIFEMPYKQLRRQLYVLHSSHGKFVTEWHKADQKAEHVPYLGLDYRKVRDGKLDEVDLARLKTVAQDFKATCKGNLFVWRPPTQVGCDEVRKKSEMFHNKFGCDGIILDNIGNLKPKRVTNDHVTNINSVVTECRFLALNFARGNTVPVFGLFHMNRQGKQRADKADGRYDSAAISYANQLEKDADVITYTYLNDELRRNGRFYMGCLKNRDNPVFERMIGKIFWQAKRMRHIETDIMDMNADRIVKTAGEISLTADDMLV
jgi:replicative DNA helicase